MLPLLFASGALALAIFAAAFKRARAESEPWPYFAKRLMTPPEQAFYQRLVRALPEHLVMAQVQASRVLGVQKGYGHAEWNNRVSRLSYDFVVCAKSTAVIAVIELDDSTHERVQRREADRRKARATAAAGIPLHRFNVRNPPSEETIRATVLPAPPSEIDESPSGEHRVLKLG